MIYEQVLKEKQNLEQKIVRLRESLANSPKGTLICCHNGHNCKWYNSDGHSRSYISKSNRKLAEQLALKKYHSLALRDALKEYEALTSYLKHTSSTSDSLSLLDIPGYRDLLSTALKPVSEELLTWSSSEYEQNPANPEKIIVPTITGQMVRSKSEAMITHCLYMNKIPFRYEAALKLGHKTIFPDFTIRHPQTGKYYYWEHFGLMEDPSYCQHVGQKICLYSSHGITPSIDLITTYEKSSHPLSTAVIEKKIESYFL